MYLIKLSSACNVATVDTVTIINYVYKVIYLQVTCECSNKIVCPAWTCEDYMQEPLESLVITHDVALNLYHI